MVKYKKYIAEAEKAAAKYVPAAAKTKPLAVSNAAPAAAEHKQTPVGWLLDMLDRPGNAVRNSLYQAINQGSNVVEGKQSFGKGLEEVVTAAPKGLFSANKDDKHTTSQIIERATDAVNEAVAKRNGQKYVNHKDDANPIAKGIGGFIGDVALDPLTYIPGADLVSVAGRAVKGGIAGVKVAKELGAAEESATAAQKVLAGVKAGAREAVKKAPTKAERAAARAAAKAAKDAAPATEQAVETATEAAPAVADATKVSETLAKQIAENSAPKVADAAPTPVPLPVEPSVNPSAAKPVEEVAQPVPTTKEQWIDHQIQALPDVVKVGGKSIKKADIDSYLKDGGENLLPEEVKAASKFVRDNLADKHYQAYVSTFGKEVSKADPVTQQAFAAASNGVSDTAQKISTALVAKSLKNIRNGAAKAGDKALQFNEHDSGKMLLDAKVAARNEKLGRTRANGLDNVVARAKFIQQSMKRAVDEIESMGAPAQVGGSPLRPDEVLGHIGDADAKAMAFLVNDSGHTKFNVVMQAARTAAHWNGSDDELFQSLYPKILAATQDRGGQFVRLDEAQAAARTAGAAFPYKESAASIAANLTRAIVSKREDIAADIAGKTKFWADRRGEDGLNISNTMLTALRGLQGDLSNSDYIQAAANLPRMAERYSREIGAVPGAAEDAAERVTREVPTVDVAQSKAVVQTAKAVEDAAKEVPIRRVPLKPVRKVDAAAFAAQKPSLKAADVAVEANESDLATVAAQHGAEVSEMFGPKEARAMIAAHGSMLYRLLSNFKADLGSGKYFRLYQNSEGLTRTWMNHVNGTLSAFAKKYNQQTRVDAFKAIQAGATPSDPILAEAVADLKPVVDKLFDTSPDGLSLLNTPVYRTGGNWNLLNRSVRTEGYRINLDAAQVRAEEKGTDLFHEIGQQWKYQDVSDPIDFLIQHHQAMIQETGYHAAAQGFMQSALREGAISDVPKPGFVKFVGERYSNLAPHLDPTKFYDKRALVAFRDVDRIISDMKNVNNVPKYVKAFDTLQNLWKVGMTSLRPGFHIRNAIGDTALTMLDTGKINPKNFTRAMRVIHVHGSYDEMDARAALLAAGESEITSGGEKILDVTLKGGKKQALTNEAVYRFAKNEGLLQDFNTFEGILEDGASPLQKVTSQIGKRTGFNKVTAAANQAATYETHHARLVHFLQVMEDSKGKFDNVGQLAEYAAARVKKFHPDPSMLSPFEKKYLRRIIPFYSWQRAMLPLVAESLLTRPGRVMLYPRASYNMGVALGVDPYSVSQPFPEDQQFPSFITNQAIGPVANIQGKNYSITPGIATTDTISDYVGANPLRTIAGGLTPAIKAPIELGTGKNLQTGGNIGSASDYILNQIPGANYVNKLSKDTSDPNAKVTNEDKDLTVLNWLSGLGIQDLNKPSYQKYAQYEQSQKSGG